MSKINPVKEMMRGTSYCESTSVSSTRKDKSCSICGVSIPKGSAHSGAKVYQDEYTQLNFCNDCEERYPLQLKEMKNGKYDTY